MMHISQGIGVYNKSLFSDFNNADGKKRKPKFKKRFKQWAKISAKKFCNPLINFIVIYNDHFICVVY